MSTTVIYSTQNTISTLHSDIVSYHCTIITANVPLRIILVVIVQFPSLCDLSQHSADESFASLLSCFL